MTTNPLDYLTADTGTEFNTTHPARRALVLNVDDDEAGRYAKSRILQLAGHQVIEAATGADALKLLKQAQPQLVLLDMKLPDVSGLDVCQTIKSDPATSHIMVLQISAIYTAASHRVTALDCGADTYLMEPVQAEELKATVKALLRLYDREQENRRLLAQLRDADKNKDDFLAMLGHELRNPLGVINNVLQLLAAQESGVAGTRELRAVLQRQVTQMARLVDDLLDIARISRGQIRLERTICDLTVIVRDTLEDCRGFLESNRLAIKTNLPDRSLWVFGDRTRLTQCVANLLHNAGKFTDPGGSVEVILDSQTIGDCAVLTVRDTGIGMAPETLASVFEAASRYEGSIERGQGGLGLGLALVKGFIGLHGGEVRALSEGPGGGSEFIIRLPLCEQTVEQRAPEVSNVPESKRYRVLIIDDSAVAARALSLLLTRQGHTVRIAHTGPDGVNAAKEFQPDVVLCDIELPGFDGYEVAQQLKKQLVCHVLLIAVSGYGGNEVEERASRAGFDRCLMKPLDLNELEHVLQTHFSPRD